MAFVACAPSCVFAGILSQPASEHFGDHLDPRVLRSERVVLSLSSLLLRPDPRVSTAPPDFPGTWLYRGSSPDNLVWAAIETVPALATSLFFGCRPAPTPGDLSPACAQLLQREHRPSHNPECLASPSPTVSFERPLGLLVDGSDDAISSLPLRPPKLLAPWTDRPRCTRIGPPGLLHPSLLPTGSPPPGVGYHYGAELGNLRRRVLPPQDRQRYRLHRD